MGIKHYHELIVWQKAMDLVVMVYKLTAGFPREELFGLTLQVRKAAVSVPSNIAEGQGRDTTRDFLHFLSIARGSLQEAETQMFVAERLAYVPSEQMTALLALSAEVGRLM